MSFFVAHASIDEKHSAQVHACIERYATTPNDQALIRTVAQTTLFLTGQMMEQVAQLHR
jgi:hypothetical protein